MILTPKIISFARAGAYADGASDGNSLALSGTAVPQSIVSLFDGDSLLGSTEANAAGTWNFVTGALTDGKYSFSAAAVDADGNNSAESAALIVMVDAQNLTGSTANVLMNSDTSDGRGAADLVVGDASFGAAEINLAEFGSYNTNVLGSGVNSTGNATGPITIAEGATAEIAGISNQAVTFGGTTGTLRLDDAVTFKGQVSGLAGSDGLDLTDVSYDANTSATFLGNTQGGTLTVTDGTNTANIALVGNYLSSTWDLSSDGNGGTIVVDPVSANNNNWQTLEVGAGGFVDGIDVAPDGTMVVRTDTYGAYIWNGTEWQQLVTATSMPAAFVTPNANTQGVYEIQIAPSSTNVLYMMYEGHVFHSSNDGTTWTETNFAQVTAGPNDNYREIGQKMAVDPNNPNVVYVGTPQNGLFVTKDGGVTWQSVSAVPVSQTDGTGSYPGIEGILFDPALGVTGGKTNTIFAGSYGNGVYESTNAGTSWTLLSGGPTNVISAAVSSTGVYYAVQDNGITGSLWSYANGQWKDLYSNVSGWAHSVAVNPLNPSEIVFQGNGGGADISYDGGATWSGYNSNNILNATDVPWLATTDAHFMSIGSTAFNPLVPNELIATAGVGVWTTDLPTANFTPSTPINWTSQSVGINQIVANEIIVPPGGDPVLASWDRPFFYISNLNEYAASYSPNTGGTLAQGWSVDYASSNPTFIAGIADWYGIEESGYSTNGGQTWTVFPSFPAVSGEYVNGTLTGQQQFGGTIAASTPENIIWAPSGGVDPYYTLNGGETWNPITLPGVTNWSGFDWAYYLDARTVTADRVLPNTFYLYYAGNGVYETTNGGVTWTQQSSGLLGPQSYYNAELQSVPGEAGNLFFTGGPLSGSVPSEGFYQSTNGGAAWTAVPNVSQVNSFGFGAAAPGQTYPAIYIVGYVNNVYGIWQSINDAHSWTQIGTYPGNSLDEIKTISGDPNIYGQVYVGFSGSGYAYLPGGPLVSAITASPATGVEGVGTTITFTLTMTEVATVAGTPTLSLNDGGTATYSGGSGTGALTFSYTVSGSDSDVSALAITKANLPNGATITDASGNSANLTGALTTFSGLQIDPPHPKVLSVAETPSSGDLNAGKSGSFTLNFSEAVTVSGGTPTLTLNDGGTATYTNGSGTNALIFTYTVGAGQTTSALAATTLNLNAASINDAAGNTADLSLTSLTQSGPQIDTTTPTVASVLASGTGITSGSGDLNVGQVVTLTLNLSEAVTVTGGIPTLALNDGGIATYSGGSGTSALTFTYTVGASQNTPDLAVTAVNPNSASITDGAGNAANLAGAVSNLPGVLQIETMPPAVSSVVMSGAYINNGVADLSAGKSMTVTLNMSAAVTVAGGTPTLTLNDGGTATYSGGSGTSALTFAYTVGAGQNTAALAVSAINLNKASITDGAGNPINPSLGGLPQSGVQIDTSNPTVLSLVESPSSGDLNAGKVVTVTYNMSEAVTLSGGVPTLTFNDGGTATYTSGSGTSALTFSYTVGVGQNTVGLIVSNVNQNGATIADGAGNAAFMNSPANTSAGPQIDTIAPGAPAIANKVVNGNNTVGLTGAAEANSTIKVYDGATLLGNATGNGSGAWTYTTPTLANGGHSLTATATDAAGNISASSSSIAVTITNSATVAAPNITSFSPDTGVVGDGITNTGTITLAGSAGANATVKVYDGATLLGSAAANGSGAWSYTTAALANGGHSLTATATDAAGNVSTASAAMALTIDTVAPVAPSIASFSPDSGTVGDGITSVATLTLNGSAEANSIVKVYDGATLLGSATANGSGSWTYTTAALSNGGHSLTATATDAAGNVSTASSAMAVTIDTVAPVAPSITSFSPDTGVVGDHITNTGTVTLAGSAEANSTVKVYDGATLLGSATANGSGAWTYTTAALANGGHNLTATATDAAGNSSSTSGAMAVTIDTTAPTVSSITASPPNGTFNAGKMITLTIGLSENVTVNTAGGSPTLTLNDGGTATYVSGSGTNALVFSYTVLTGENTPDLKVAGVNLNGATLQDTAGNAANLSISGVTQGSPAIDTIAPVAPSITSFSPDTGVVGDGITNTGTVTLTGAAEANSTVKVYDGATLLGNATANGSGAWTYTTTALANGGHSMTATATDAAGNISSASSAMAVTIDTVAPAAPTIISDISVNPTIVTLTGSAEANSQITVFDGNSNLGTAITNSLGLWTFTSGTLAQGNHAFTATATDAAGNTSALSNVVNPIVDTVAPVAPTIASLSPNNGIMTVSGTGVLALDGNGFSNKPTWTTSASVMLTTTKANDVIILDVVQNGTSVSTVSDTAGLVWHQRAVAGSGAQTIYEYYAIAPNALSADTITVNSAGAASYLDLNAFGISGANTSSPFDSNVSAPATPATSTGSVTTSNANDMIIAGYRFGADATPTAGSGWTAINASGGYYLSEYQIVSATQAGLVATASTADQNGGIVDAIVQAGSTLTSASVLTLTGSTEANATVKVYDGATLLGNATANASGAWSYTTPTLANGAHSLTATATDAAGNVSAASGAMTFTVDTVAPVAPSIASFSPDTGVVGDHITNTGTVTLTGSAEANSTVKVYDGATLLGSATTNGNGAWSYTTAALANGGHSLTATATDAAGNVSSASSATALTIDTVAPVAPSIASFSPDSGTVGDGITNVGTLTLTGSAEANSTVKVYDGATLLGSATANGSGAWTYTTAALANGGHSLTATATDAAGNISSASSAMAVTVDTVAPVAPSISINGGSGTGVLALDGNGFSNKPTWTTSASVMLTTTKANDVIILDVVQNGTSVSTVSDTAGLVWHQRAVAGSGAQTIYEYYAVAPNALSADTITVNSAGAASYLDLNAFGISGANTSSPFDSNVSAPATPATSTGSVTTSNANDMIIAGYRFGADATPTAGSGWTAINASGGYYLSEYQIVSATQAGLVATASTADQNGGIVDAIVQAGSTLTSASVLTLTGSTEANATVKVYDGATLLGNATANTSGAWSYTTPTLANGAHSLTATATDAAGNVSAASGALAITVGPTSVAAPTIGSFSPDSNIAGDGITNASVLTLTGAAVANSTVNIYDGATLLGSATTNGSGAWSYTTAALANGGHSLTATATDAAGNVSTASSAMAVTIDTVAPVAPSIASFSPDSGTVGDGITNVGTLTLTGSAEANSTVKVYDGATLLGSATANGSGAWSYTTAALSNGGHSLTATATDAAGNVSSASAAMAVTIDTVAPVAPSITSFSPDSGTVGDGITNAATLTLTGSAEANSTVKVYDGATLLGSATANGSGAWTYTTAALSNGGHSLTATATDAAGNVSAASAAMAVTIDTVAPVAPGIASFSPDSGVVGDHITNTGTVTLAGSAEANATVKVYDGATLLGSAIANGSGAWTYTTAALSNGGHSLTATATDAAGNVSSASGAMAVTIDTVAPVAPSITSFSPDTGVVGDGITNTGTVTLTGAAEANSTVKVYDGATLLGSATANGSGAWTYTTAALANGGHSLTATATDAAGNVSSASGAMAVTIDTVAPVAPSITSFSPDTGIVGDGITNNTTLTLTGASEANSTVKVYDGATLLGSATANGSGAWTYTTTALANGGHSLTATAIDAAGNVSSTSSAMAVTIDTVAPVAPSIASFSPDTGVVGDGITNTGTITLAGAAEANSTVKVYDGATLLGSATANGSGAWTYTTAALANGGHSLTATAIDAAGNVSSTSSAMAVTIDTVAPVAPSIASFSPDTGVVGDGITNTGTVTLTGAAEANSTVKVYDGATLLGSATANGSGAWTYTTAALANGGHSLTATATDAAGNISSASSVMAVTIDTVAPVAPSIASFSPDTGVVGDHITNTGTVTLAGSAEANATVKVYDGATLLGSATANGSGAWTYTTAALANGGHSLTATATDAAGNISSASTAMAVTIDTVAPVAPSIASFSPDSGIVGDGITNVATLTLTGSAEANATVKIYDGATLLGSATANGSGAWTYTTAALANGGHSLTATATDAAGNVSSASSAMAVTIDTVAPVAPSITSFSPDSGVVGDGITNTGTVTLTGSAEANSTVKVYDGATLLGSATTNGSGAWTYTTAALSNGGHSLTATATDTAGNVSSASSAMAVAIDTVAPVAPSITSFSPDSGTVGDGITNNTTLTLTGSAEANATVKVYDGATLLGNATANGSGAWTYTTATLANGGHSLTATATDAAGNVSTASAAMAVTIDTVAPVAPSITSDTFVSANVVTLVGAAEANSTVKVYDGATLLGSATADGSGAWTYTTAALANGAHSFTATATDAAGNTSLASPPVDPTVDTTILAAPIIASFSTDSGVVGDGITNNTTLTLTGSAEANATVKVYDGATLLGSTTADGSGAWTYTTAALANGGHSLTATATDAAGDVSTASAAMAVTIDIVAPVAPSIASFSPDTGVVGDHITNTGTVTLTGAAEANSTIKVYDGATLLGSATANGSGAWTYTTAALSNGGHSLTATATDAAGNVSSASSAMAVTIDTVAPVAPSITSFSPDSGTVGDGITNTGTVTLTGAAEANSTVKVYDGATLLGSATANGSGAWSYTTAALSNGGHSLTATATDAAGNVSPASSAMAVTIDTVAPVAPSISSFSPDSGTVGDGITNNTTLTLNGSAEANSTVKVYDGATLLGSATANGSGAWNYTTAALANGGHSLTATATDAAGNVSTASSALAVTIDTVAPVAPSIASFSADSGVVGDGITNDATLTLTGSAEANSAVKVYDGATLLGSATANGSGAWTYTTAALSNGGHSLTATATDAAGNISSASSAMAVTIDTVAPVAPSITSFSPDSGTVGDGITNVATLTLNGSAEANSTVKVYDGATLLGSATASGSGAWTYTTAALANGGHSLTATATDAAGNVSSTSSAMAVTIDTVAPIAPSITSFSPDSGVVGDHITDINTLMLNGFAEANSSVKVYDGVTLLGSVTANGSGAWNYATQTLADGGHSFAATDTDAAGNISSASAAMAVTVDTVAPVAPSITGDIFVSANILTLTGSAEANATIKVYDGATLLGTSATNANGAWSLNTGTLANGVHGFMATATDAAGNTSAATSEFDVSITNLQAPIALTDASLILSSKGAAILAGTSDAGSTISVVDANTGSSIGQTTAAANGAWSLSINGLSNSIHAFTETATNQAGNAGSTNVVFGTVGNDTFVSGPANQTFVGRGGSDTFVFSGNFGKDTITDFASNDVLQLDSHTFTNFAGVLAHAAQVGSDVVIAADSLDTITLHNTLLTQLTTNNVHLVEL